MGQIRVKTRWGKIRGCLGPSYDFQIYTTYMKTIDNALNTALSINIKILKYDHSHLNIILWHKDKHFC